MLHGLIKYRLLNVELTFYVENIECCMSFTVTAGIPSQCYPKHAFHHDSLRLLINDIFETPNILSGKLLIF